VANNNFLVSVADAVVRDVASDQILFKGKALINTAFKQSLTVQEIRAGFGNGLQYIFSHDKKLDVSLESATFETSFISLNNGTNIANSLKDVYIIDEVVTLASGSGTVANTPIGNINIQKSDGSVITVAPTGSNFAVAGGANTVVKATYRYNATVDNITIDAGSSPNAFELTLSAKVFDVNGQTGNLQIRIPSWKISGSFDLSFGASSVSTSKLDGNALSDAFGNLAYVSVVPVGSSVITYQAIAAIPSAVAISVGTPTAQLVVYGIRSGLYSNVVVTAGCTFVSGTPATCTVGATTGLITRVGTGSSVITVTHTASGITDTATVTSA
jgi:hypothetical protein